MLVISAKLEASFLKLKKETSTHDNWMATYYSGCCGCMTLIRGVACAAVARELHTIVELIISIGCWKQHISIKIFKNAMQKTQHASQRPTAMLRTC